MTKEITVSDAVYERIQRERGDRSVSEYIASRLDAGGRLADVTGQRILDPAAAEDATAAIDRMSDGTMERLDDEQS